MTYFLKLFSNIRKTTDIHKIVGAKLTLIQTQRMSAGLAQGCVLVDERKIGAKHNFWP
jgi:hypothetical protein